MGNYFDIQDNPNDPPLSHYLLYAGIGAVINPASSLVGFVFLGLLRSIVDSYWHCTKNYLFLIYLGICVAPSRLYHPTKSVWRTRQRRHRAHLREAKSE